MPAFERAMEVGVDALEMDVHLTRDGHFVVAHDESNEAHVGDTVRTRVYLAPESDWRGAVKAHRELFEGVDPANTTLFVAGFIPEGVLVEVELDAWVAE